MPTNPKKPKPKQQPQQPKIVSGLRPVTEDGDNPKDKYGLAKVPFTVIPSSALVIMAMAMKTGTEKYGIYSWRKSKVQSRIYLEAAFRHLIALLDGEDYDPSTGIPHAGFVMATVAIFIDALVTGNLIDNRVLPGRTGELISLYNQTPGSISTPKELRQKLEAFINGTAKI